MSALDTLTGFIISAFGGFLISLCFIMLLKPGYGKKFLESFASSARAHYTEQLIRMVFGLSLVLHQSYDHFGYYLQILGWVVIATTIGLLIFPWKWHHKFAGKVIPPVIRFMKLYALMLLAFGAMLIWVV